ncbi:MAG: FkbM family methyltransferase, partial [Xanthomonadales bacterium]|nr:FkbM family methyltransferase [Xanthomonadales bacterium]
MKRLVINCDSLTGILRDCGVPGDFSLLSVDTEGHDLQVLQGLDP